MSSDNAGMPIEATKFTGMKPLHLQRPDGWIGHIPFSFWLVENLKPKRIVELGTHTGNSFFSFCQIVEKLELETECIAVDTWQGDEHAGEYSDVIYNSVNEHAQKKYPNIASLMRSLFNEAVGSFDDGSIDLLHIDGLHTYDAVKDDYETWIDKLAPNGVVIFHDTAVRDRGFGVYQLWNELKQKHGGFEFIHSNGLGVLAPKGISNPQIECLIKSGENFKQTQEIRSHFESHASTIVGQYEKKFFAELMAEKTEQQTLLQQHYNALGGQLEAAKQERDQVQTRLEEANSQEKLLQENYSALNGQLETAKQERDRLQVLLNESMDQQGLLQKHYDSLSKELEATQKDRAKLEQDQANLEDDRLELEQERDKLEHDCKALEKKVELVTLRSQAQQTECDALQERILISEVALIEQRNREERTSANWEEDKIRLAQLEDEFIQVTRRLQGGIKSRMIHIIRDIKTFGVDVVRKVLGKNSRIRNTLLITKQAILIRRSGLFDSTYYREQLPDHQKSEMDLVGHYISSGDQAGLKPNKFFDPVFYRQTYHDLRDLPITTLEHYISNGSHEGRATSSEFDSGFYRKLHEDIAAIGIDPLKHFLQNGQFEGRKAVADKLSMESEGASFFPLVGRHNFEQSLFELGAPGSNVDDILPKTSILNNEPLSAKVDVIIPVYGGETETKTCIESTIKYMSDNKSFGKLYLVDDCGPEPALRAALPDYAKTNENIVLLVNDENLGFVKSVNRAMKASDRDVVLLNADTEVHGNWLDRMTRQALSHSNVATVTAFSNNATICTYPAIGGAPELPNGYSLAQLDDACSQANELRAVEMPTGVGFCMFISRASLSEIGYFDEEYGKGYGEENDYCQKALANGWKNILAGDVFVFHHGSVSFGESAAAEQLVGGEILRNRYPDYEPSVSRWIECDPALPLRFSVSAKLIQQSNKPRLMHVLHPWGGGTEKQVAELIKNTSAEALHMVMITQELPDGFMFAFLLPEGEQWRRFEFKAQKLSETIPILDALGVDKVHFHHVLVVIDEMDDFLAVYDGEYDLSIHDYSLVCPRNNLINSEGSYCGEPDEFGCLKCLREKPDPRSKDIIMWRQKGRNILNNAARIVCPTIDVASRIQKYSSNENIVAVPHEKELYHPKREVTLSKLGPADTLKIVSIGIMAQHKGGGFLLDCIEQSVLQKTNIEWEIIGEFPNEFDKRVSALSGVLKVTGRYAAEELPELISAANPHLVFFPQHCAETYSYTLSEAFSAGLPILAPQLGAFSERVSGVSACWLYDSEKSAIEVVQQIIELKNLVFQTGDLHSVPNATFDTPKDFKLLEDFYEKEYIDA